MSHSAPTGGPQPVASRLSLPRCVCATNRGLGAIRRNIKYKDELKPYWDDRKLTLWDNVRVSAGEHADSPCLVRGDATSAGAVVARFVLARVVLRPGRRPTFRYPTVRVPQGHRPIDSEGNAGDYVWRSYDEVLGMVNAVGAAIVGLELAPRLDDPEIGRVRRVRGGGKGWSLHDMRREGVTQGLYNWPYVCGRGGRMPCWCVAQRHHGERNDLRGYLPMFRPSSVLASSRWVVLQSVLVSGCSGQWFWHLCVCAAGGCGATAPCDHGLVCGRRRNCGAVCDGDNSASFSVVL